MRLFHSLIVKTREIQRLLIFSLTLVSLGVMAQTPVETPKTIRVVTDNAYAPYSFQSDDGKLQGILIDQWQAWEKKTGIKAEIRAMDWGEALRRMRAGEFDVIDSIVETSERRAYFDFTPAYTTIEASIYFRKDISGISDLASLKGFPVGVKTGDQHIDQLKTNGVTTVIEFQNNDAIVEAAKQHKINVFVVDDPSALYLLNKLGVEEEFRHSAPVFRDELRRAVRKGDEATLRMVSEGFAAIDAGELKQIDEKWFGWTINRYGRYLTYAGYVAAVAILLIAGLVAWNRTLRKRIAQRTAALGESEQRFRQIAENIREVFWLRTADFSNMLYTSPAYQAVWGRTRESLCQDPRSFIEAIHVEDRARVTEVIERDREKGFQVEYRVLRPDGSIRWIRDRGFPIKDESGRFYRVAGIAEDITERKEAEDALRRSEDRLRLVIDTVPALIHTGLPDGQLDFFNQRWLDFVGLSLEDLSGWKWTAAIHPEDVKAMVERWRAALATGEPYEHEARVRRADGEYRWMVHREVPLRDERGNIVKWYASSIDIEDRKRAEDALRQSEDHLRMVIDTIPVMAWSTRPDGTVDFLNQRWLDYAGLSFEQYVQDPTGPVHPEDVPRIMEKWHVAMATGEPYEAEMRLRRADGEYRWFLVRTEPLRDEQGNLVKWYGVSTDIEDLKRADTDLKESQRRLREAQRIAHVGHWDRDLKTGRITWSDEIYRILGLPFEDRDSARTEWLDVVHPEDRQRLSLALEEMQRGIRRFDVEFRIVRPNGEVRFLHSQGDVIRDDWGRPLHRFGTAQDITERVSAEEELKKEKEILEKIFENIPVMIGFVGQDGRVKLVNPEWERTIGWTLKELQEQNVDIFTEAYPDPSYRQEILDFVAASTGEWVDLKIKVRDGRVIDAACAVVLLSDGTRVAIAQDITERKLVEEKLKHSEAQLAHAQRLAHVGSWDWDLRTNKVTWSDELYRIFGLEPGTIMVAGDAMSFIHPDDQDLVWSTVKNAIANKERYSFYYRALRPDGTERIVHSRGSVLTDDRGEAIRVFGATQDVTELKQAEDDLKATTDQLRALSASLQSAREQESTRIAREIHDELGGALTALRWDLEEVGGVISEPADSTQLSALRKRIEAMTTLTGTTLDTIRRLASELRPMALDELGLVEAIEWQALQFQARTGIAVEYECSQEKVDLNSEQSTAVFRILQEALTNVLRHAQATRVTITMKQESGQFFLAIKDNGRGITESEKSGAHSLGLVGMRERAHLIGAQIDIIGIEGKGTLVAVRIPVSESSEREKKFKT